MIRDEILISLNNISNPYEHFLEWKKFINQNLDNLKLLEESYIELGKNDHKKYPIKTNFRATFTTNYNPFAVALLSFSDDSRLNDLINVLLDDNQLPNVIALLSDYIKPTMQINHKVIDKYIGSIELQEKLITYLYKLEHVGTDIWMGLIEKYQKKIFHPCENVEYNIPHILPNVFLQSIYFDVHIEDDVLMIIMQNHADERIKTVHKILKRIIEEGMEDGNLGYFNIPPAFQDKLNNFRKRYIEDENLMVHYKLNN
jgi:5-bromo-4-chloroindolyl phosphate hydrolysis protein